MSQPFHRHSSRLSRQVSRTRSPGAIRLQNSRSRRASSSPIRALRIVICRFGGAFMEWGGYHASCRPRRRARPRSTTTRRGPCSAFFGLTRARSGTNLWSDGKGSVRPRRPYRPLTQRVRSSAGPLRGTAGRKMRNADAEWGASPTDRTGQDVSDRRRPFFFEQRGPPRLRSPRVARTGAGHVPCARADPTRRRWRCRAACRARR